MLMISLTLVLATGVKLIINPLGLRSRAAPRVAINIYIISELSYGLRQSHVPALKTPGIFRVSTGWAGSHTI